MHKKQFSLTKKQKKLIARSPEAFPKLTIFPEGWDLEHLLAKPFQAKTKKAKHKDKLDTFPDTTDAIL